MVYRVGGGIDWDAGRLCRGAAISRSAQNQIIRRAIRTEATVGPDNVHRSVGVDLGGRDGAAPQVAGFGVIGYRRNRNRAAPTCAAVARRECQHRSENPASNRHNDLPTGLYKRLATNSMSSICSVER